MIKFDIETSCCDGVYRDIPQPTNPKHKITKIQVLIDYQIDGKNPEVLIYHLFGYTYDTEAIKQ